MKFQESTCKFLKCFTTAPWRSKKRALHLAKPWFLPCSPCSRLCHKQSAPPFSSIGRARPLLPDGLNGVDPPRALVPESDPDRVQHAVPPDMLGRYGKVVGTRQQLDLGVFFLRARVPFGNSKPPHEEIGLLEFTPSPCIGFFRWRYIEQALSRILSEDQFVLRVAMVQVMRQS